MTSTLPIRALTRDDLPVDTVALARFLVGRFLIRDQRGGRLVGRIVETEAYPVGDSTNHAFRGRLAYNGAMFLAPGHAYVRLTYGVYHVLNVSSEPEGVGAAALIRAVEPVEGIVPMQRRRGGVALRDLARGPGRLALAFGIDGAFDSADLCTGRGLWLGTLAIHGSAREPAPLGVATRIGLTRETDRPLRFYERGSGSVFVSGPRRALAPIA